MIIYSLLKSQLRRPVFRAQVQKRLNCSGSESPLRKLLRDSSSFGEIQIDKAPDGDLLWATQPYAVKASEEPTRGVDPTEATVLLFPGQGSEWVGMGQCLDSVPAAKELYEFASSIVGWDVARVCRRGPADELRRRCQTAVLVTSLGALELARERRRGAVERVRAAAGFSLGEITALVYAGALSLERALRLTELRGAAMRAAAAERAGGMLTVWLAPDAQLARLLAAAREAARAPDLPDPVLVVASYLYPGCKVLAGDDRVSRHCCNTTSTCSRCGWRPRPTCPTPCWWWPATCTRAARCSPATTG
ncbi:probable malonyl-CoA-acyl carrier protein transacylase, mitochondrial [Leptidea sinapis]|uniref:probable malonyl-CoA-acyl carrier protein transacylase, mitochondrial n=1 Tax=Leptidea sinapis TaxID=189913 RepID=UPI0021C37B9D|nr:probable malonyl-CoA-acyl carrier protein transacylase, mitochondrial [Leptidea sinapis]